MMPWLLCALALGQSELSFDVASVKAAGPYVVGQRPMTGGPGTSDLGRVTYTRASLSFLVMQAYGVLVDQVSGPAWISDANQAYTITATMPPTTTKEQFGEMLRNLLAERFHLRVHREVQTRPGYELVVADGGLKMEEWKPGAPAPKGIPNIDAGRPTGVAFSFSMSGGTVPIRYHIRESMARFCDALGTTINMSNGIGTDGPRPRVIDKTGLTGVYDFGLEFSGVIRRAAPVEGAAAAASEPGPTLFQALGKLGLKLRRIQDVPVEVIVVDHAEKTPTEN